MKFKFSMCMFVRVLICFLLLASGSLAVVCRNEFGSDVNWLVAIRLSGKIRRYIVFDDSSAKFRFINNESLTDHLLKDIEPGVDGLLMWNDEPPTDDSSTEQEFTTTSEVKEPNSLKTRLQFGANKQDRNRGALKRLLQQEPQVQEEDLLSAEGETSIQRDIEEALGSSSLGSKSYSFTAHDKGVLYKSAKDGSGFFLLHSVPKFPAIEKRGHKLNPKTPAGSTYAQSFVCVSKHANKQDDFFDLIAGRVRGQKGDVYFDSLKITSEAKSEVGFISEPLVDTPFTFVTKLSNSTADPFEDILVPTFQTGWIAETWGRPYKEDSCTGPYSVINSRQVNYLDQVISSSKDHSKWAVAIDVEGLICVGGMNHMSSQSKRGGSFLCLKNKALYDEMRYRIIQPTPTKCPISKRIEVVPIVHINVTIDVKLETPGSSVTTDESHRPSVVDTSVHVELNTVRNSLVQSEQNLSVAEVNSKATTTKYNKSSREWHSVQSSRRPEVTLKSLSQVLRLARQ